MSNLSFLIKSQPKYDPDDVECMERIHRKLTMLYAPKGSGKSTMLACVGIKMKKYLQKEIIVIDASLDFNPKTFGRFREISIAQFQEQLELFTILVEVMKLAKESTLEETDIGSYLQALFPKASEGTITKFLDTPTYLDSQMLRKGIYENDVMSYVTAVKQACQILGIYIYDTVQFIDEALQHSGRRKSMTNRNAMLNEYYSKMRHMLSTVIVTFPDKKMFDSYGAIQLDWRGEVTYSPYSKEVNIIFRPGNSNSTGAPWDYTIPQELYRKYFNSFNAIGFMSSQYSGVRPEIKKTKEGMMI